jgi:hypothetical protein
MRSYWDTFVHLAQKKAFQAESDCLKKKEIGG